MMKRTSFGLVKVDQLMHIQVVSPNRTSIERTSFWIRCNKLDMH